MNYGKRRKVRTRQGRQRGCSGTVLAKREWRELKTAYRIGRIEHGDRKI